MSLLEQFSSALFMDKASLKSFIYTAPRRYKRYAIPKKNGNGFRTIAQPSKQIKSLQRFGISLLAILLKTHYSAHAYVEGKGIKTNAAAHQGCNHLLKMDFKDFFHSITPDILMKALDNNGGKEILDEEDRYIISHLFFWKLRGNSPLRLSIGAPTSPIISNAIMYDFDEEIADYCSGLNVKYTRYADDLTFSSKDRGSLTTIPNEVNIVLRKNFGSKIRVNKEKTLHCNKSMNRSVTGIVLNNTNDSLSLGRKKKRMISSFVHKFSFSLLDQQEINYLNGILGHAAHIEPQFIERLKEKYGQDVIAKIKASIEYL